MHVLTPVIMDILAGQVASAQAGDEIALAPALAELARRERYLALEAEGWRYDVGVKYGLLAAQLASVPLTEASNQALELATCSGLSSSVVCWTKVAISSAVGTVGTAAAAAAGCTSGFGGGCAAQPARVVETSIESP
jgi:hypothetical protein